MFRRDVLWIGFGGLWIVDGLLQAQPAMFTRQFVARVLQPAAEGQPGWLGALMAEGVRIWQAGPVAANVGAILVELLIGALLLLGRERRWGRVGLGLAIGWGLLVWVAGEGAGDLLAGQPSALTGLPGAALVYVVGAILLLLPRRAWQSGEVVRWTRHGLGGLWLLAALAQALPMAGYWTAEGLGWLFQTVADQPQPALLATPISWVGALAALHPVSVNALFVAIMAALGIAFLTGRDHAWAVGLAAVWLGFSWWMGQDFGAIFSGTATDPSTALPLGLLTLAVAPRLVWEKSRNRTERGWRLSPVVATSRPIPLDRTRPRAG